MHAQGVPSLSGMTLPIADDIEFWSRQLSEHALFMQLGLDDKRLKRIAEGLHAQWERYRHGPRAVSTAISLVAATRELQTEVHSRLVEGSWLGWLWPLFIDHIRREGDYFLTKLQGQLLSDVDECKTWLTFMAEHAAFASHLLDPSEAQRIQQALTLLGDFNHLWRGCAPSMNEQLLSLTRRSGLELDAYFKSLGIGTPGAARSIIHPALAEHVVREGQRFLLTISILQGQI
jgi:Domain of unknown function (DUF2935)